jgi:hypothetical protein
MRGATSRVGIVGNTPISTTGDETVSETVVSYPQHYREDPYFAGRFIHCVQTSRKRLVPEVAAGLPDPLWETELHHTFIFALATEEFDLTVNAMTREILLDKDRDV